MVSIKKYKDKITWVVFGLFLIITFSGILYHEPWSDEAQVWLMARDLTFSKLIQQLPYEGTPGLWHALVFPIAKLNLPYEAQAWLHWLIISSAIFIFLFFSTIPKRIKALFVFSYYPIYEYAVIARNYSISLLFIFILSALHKERFVRPITYSLFLGLLFQTNLLVFFPAILLMFLFIIDSYKNESILKNNKYLISISIMITSACLAILQIIPYPGQLHAHLSSLRISELSSSLAGIFLPINGGYGEVFFINIWSQVLSLLTLFCLILLAYFLIKNIKVRLGLLLSWAWLIFIFLAKPIGALRHYGFFIIFLITAWWLDRYYLQSKNKASHIATSLIGLLLLPGIIIAGNNYVKEYKYNFCGGKEMARYLKDNNLEDAHIASLSSPINMSLLPYLPNTKFWQAERQVFGTYTTYDAAFINGLVDHELRKEKIIQNFANQDFLLLTTFKIDSENWLLITQNKKPSFSGGFFYLYRFLK